MKNAKLTTSKNCLVVLSQVNFVDNSWIILKIPVDNSSRQRGKFAGKMLKWFYGWLYRHWTQQFGQKRKKFSDSINLANWAGCALVKKIWRRKDENHLYNIVKKAISADAKKLWTTFFDKYTSFSTKACSTGCSKTVFIVLAAERQN